MTKQNLNETEVAATTGIGVRQLRRMRASNRGPRFIKISGQIGQRGGRIVYPLTGVNEWLESRPCGGEALAAQ